MILRTPRLLLRELALTDAPLANEYEKNPEVVKYMTHEPRSLEESEEYIRCVLEEEARAPRTLFDLAVVRAEDDRYIGRAGFTVGNPDEHQAMLWYVIDPSAWGKGYAVEAARALLAFAFGELGLHRVWLDADPLNLPSVRVAEKLGFRKEAHHLENAFLKGVWLDSVIYALLEREWKSAHG